MKKVQQGFTLIELMIVVAIIGILAAIAIPAYSDYITRAKWSDTVSSVASIKTAIGECLDDNAGAATSCDDKSELEPYGVSTGALGNTKYEAVVTIETSASIGLDGTGATELGSLCDYNLTPVPQANHTEWVPLITQGGAPCVKFVKGASTSL